MKNCEFNVATCPVNCVNYNICQFTFLQKQLSEVQSQITFIYRTLADIAKCVKSNDQPPEVQDS